MSNIQAAAPSLPAMRSEDATRLTLATVMLVDDDAGSAASVQASLEAAGYGDIVVLTDPARTEEMLGLHEPDVLMMTVRMAHASGLHLLGRLRAGEQWRQLPVIMLAADDDSDGKRQALDLGATDILSMPLDDSELVLRLRNALGFKAYQDRLLKRDPLTGLANRLEFMRRVQTVLAKLPLREGATASSAERIRCSVILLNIDRFKQVNDSFGHAAGDAMLTAIAKRLSAVVAKHAGGNRRADSSGLTPWLARLDSDRFMALLPGARGMLEHDQAVREIVASIAVPVHLNRREFHVSASIGVAGFPDDGDSAEVLVQRAGFAATHATRRGGNAVEYFTTDMQTRAGERLTLGNHLRYAIRRKELRLHYQPKVDCATLRMVGVEALIRWQHPLHGLIAPQRFIPIAEEAGLIDDIGEWALREACRQGAQWIKDGLPPIHIAVNLSAAQLLQGDLAGNLSRILAHSGFPASRLTLELTESMLMTAGDSAARTIDALKALGVALSLDDFGTGYSPLTYLRRLPIDEIKIDRSFVHGLPTQQDSAAIAGAIITLAGALGLQVVAEGVETAAELKFLCQFSNCRFQGYLFSKPVPAETLTEMLHSMRDSITPLAE